MILATIALLATVAVPAPVSPDAQQAQSVTTAIVNELKRYARDAGSLTLAPLRWDRRQWLRFAEGTALVAGFYAADQQLYDDVQRHRNSSTDHFARTITPFGGHRALELSALMIVSGALAHEPQIRDAGRDSLESELWAAGVVTPLLKRAFGRARPSQDEGAHSFHSFSKSHEGFPSGHATNAFALATAVAGHSDGWVIPTIVYSVASGVAISRVNDRAHFPSDVLAGALIGCAVAKGVVARNHRSHTTWLLTPTVINRRPVLTLHITAESR